MILQTNDHVTFIKSIIRNASEEGRCVNEIESEEIANSLKAMLQECDDLENCMVTANQNTIKYESLIMKLNELMNCISEYPWVLDTAIDGIGELIVKVNQKAHLKRKGTRLSAIITNVIKFIYNTFKKRGSNYDINRVIRKKGVFYL